MELGANEGETVDHAHLVDCYVPYNMPVKRKSDSSDPDVGAKRKMVQTTLNNCTINSTLSQQQSSGGHWQVTKSLLIYTPSDLKPSSKVLALDLDGTIITTASGKTFPKDNNDWKLLNNRICQTLRDYSANGFKLVIISNQRGISKGYQDVASFQRKAENIVHALALPVQCYFSIVPDLNRKPLTGMWEELERTGNQGVAIDRSASFYCGDAAGRPAEGTRKKDHACSDRLFALNLGVPFLTPEQLWFGRTESGVFSMPQFDPTSLLTCPASLPLLERPKCTELILLVGYPASGKSRFAQKYLAPLGYTIISRDVLGSWQKCVQACSQALAKGTSVVVDNTNMDVESRARYLEVARAALVPVRCFVMQVTVEHAKHNERFRVLTDSAHKPIGPMVFNTLKSKYQPPTAQEGFAAIITLPFVLDQTHEHLNLYCKHLLEK